MVAIIFGRLIGFGVAAFRNKYPSVVKRTYISIHTIKGRSAILRGPAPYLPGHLNLLSLLNHEERMLRLGLEQEICSIVFLTHLVWHLATWWCLRSFLSFRIPTHL